MPELAVRTLKAPPVPASLKGEWAELYSDTVVALLERYGARGPQYQMLADLAAGLYVQVRRMEATGAIRGLESIDEVIARQLKLHEDEDSEEIVQRAQQIMRNASEAVNMYLKAIEALRKLIEQSQKYTEARKQEVVVTEVNSAVVEVLRLVETMVDPTTFARIIIAVRAALKGEAA